MKRERIEEIEQLLSVAEIELSSTRARTSFLLQQIASLKREKEYLLPTVAEESPEAYASSPVTCRSSETAKIGLFRNLFHGREDVYAKRFESHKTGRCGYQPACKNEWLAGICEKPAIKCSRCEKRDLIPITDMIIRHHLTGADSAYPGSDFTIGIFPLLLDETCWFLAIDFDETTWTEDAQAFRKTCWLHGIFAHLERSRSGNGGHVWIFFSEKVPAKLARSLGSLLLTETIEQRPEIGLKSYDRLFPNQDTLPHGGFGNLIALPLQCKPRQKGNSVFLDEDLTPFQDQWAHLSSVRRLKLEELGQLVQELSKTRQELGPRTGLTDFDEEKPWERKRFTDWLKPEVRGPLPERLSVTMADQLYIGKQGVPPTLRNRIMRSAAFPNPEFHRAQALRLPTYGKPRIICCAEEFPEYVALPRGCFEELVALTSSLGVSLDIHDSRVAGENVHMRFNAVLTDSQAEAAQALLDHDIGVLVAPTAFGKTVVAAWLIAQRQVNTLVLVHTRQLMDQWIERLKGFLDLKSGTIGQIGSGKKAPGGCVDIGMLQSMIHRDQVDPIVDQYGQIIVDECHHISARSFELVTRTAKAKYIAGFSATVERKDGHHPIIFMQCGPIRHVVTLAKQQNNDQIRRGVLVRKTGFILRGPLAEFKSLTIHDIYEELLIDSDRNGMIVADAISCLAAGHWPLILTERKRHVELLAERLMPAVPELIVLTGGMNQRQWKKTREDIRQNAPRLILATGRCLGEGFDDDRLDTLLLAMPISWKGTLTQYAGRLHRSRSGKREVMIYDYADLEVPMLKRMFQKRLSGYKRLGYTVN